MVGREVVESIERALPVHPLGALVLAMRDVEEERPGPALRGVSLDIRAGEIRAAGVAGNGQSELAGVLLGLRRHAGIRHRERRRGRQPHPREAITLRIAHEPEDRTGVGSAPDLSVADSRDLRQPLGRADRAPLVDDTGAVRRVADRLRRPTPSPRHRWTPRRACSSAVNPPAAPRPGGYRLQLRRMVRAQGQPRPARRRRDLDRASPAARAACSPGPRHGVLIEPATLDEGRSPFAHLHRHHLRGPGSWGPRRRRHRRSGLLMTGGGGAAAARIAATTTRIVP